MSKSQNIGRSKENTPVNDSRSAETEAPGFKLEEAQTRAQREYYHVAVANRGQPRTVLDFRGKRLDDKDAKELALLVRTGFQEIDVLDLGNNYFTTKALKSFLKNLQKIRVTELKMDMNNLDLKTVNYLTSFAKYNRHLRRFVYGVLDVDLLTLDVRERIAKLKSRGLHVEFTNF